MKRIFALIAAVMLISGCVPHTELDKVGIAEAVGVDYADGIYTVTVQYFNTDASGGVTAVDSTAPNVKLARGRGKSIESALQAVSYTSGNSVMFGSAAVIVFGEDALFSAEGALRLAASHYCGNLRAYIAAARGKAEDILNVRFNEGNASVEKLKEMMSNAEKLGLTRNVLMHEAMERLASPTGSVVLPLLQAYNDGSDATEDGMNVIIAGGVLCTGGRFADKLAPAEMSGLYMLSGGSECELTLLYRGDEARVMMYNIVPSITPSFSEGILCLDISLTADCKTVSTSIPDPYAAREEVARLCADEAERRVSALLAHAYTAYGADAAGLSYAVRSHSPALWQQLSPDFRSCLMTASFTVRCSVRMERYGILQPSRVSAARHFSADAGFLLLSVRATESNQRARIAAHQRSLRGRADFLSHFADIY